MKLSQSSIRTTETPRHRGRFLKYMSLCLSVSVVCGGWLSSANGQLLDKVVARVNGTAITQSDVQAALGLGLVEAQPGQDPIASGTRQMIDRQLMLTEVARFPPPEPADSAIADAVAQMKARAGTRYDALIRQTGLDEQRLRELARETLRIEAYVNQRFGTTESAERRRAMVAQWIEDLRVRGNVVEVTSRP
jgi:parvulin-like peptidyl-prolyl isomerase